MRIARSSPLFRIALLSLAVLFAHTVRANTQPILPASPPCPGKVAAAQPDPEKKPPLGIRRITKPRNLQGHNWFGSSFARAHCAGLLSLPGLGPPFLARSTVYILPQRRPFALRI